MSDNITFITHNEHTGHWDAAARKLWEENFDDSEEYCDFYFNERFRDSSAFFSGEAGMMHLCPYQLCFCGNEISADYIVGVCTVKNERRKGHMARLLRECFKMLYQKKKPFLYLMPADTNIYYPFGFREFYKTGSYHGSLNKAVSLYLRETGFSKIKIKEYKKLSASEKEGIFDFAYRQIKSKAQCFVKRSDEYFKLRADEMESCHGALLTFWEEEFEDELADEVIGKLIDKTKDKPKDEPKVKPIGKTPIGYAMLMMEDGAEISEFVVKEGFEYLVLKALEDILREDERQEIHLCETMFLSRLSGAKKNMLMGRIICVEEFVPLLNIQNTAAVFDKIRECAGLMPHREFSRTDLNEDSIYLDITDKLIPGNSGLWKLTSGENGAGIIRIKSDFHDAQALSCKITIEELFVCLTDGIVFYMNEMV